MSTTVEIRPFDVDVPQEELDDLRRRIGATRFADEETVGDQSQGVQSATIQGALFRTPLSRSLTVP